MSPRTLSILADAVVLLHFGFVLFVTFGGFIVLRWRRVAWAHVPAVVWGAFIEYAGWICPLTPLGLALRHRAGQTGYTGGFIDHYITRVLYPAGLTQRVQIAIGTFVLLLNAAIYWRVWRRLRVPAAIPHSMV